MLYPERPESDLTGKVFRHLDLGSLRAQVKIKQAQPTLSSGGSFLLLFLPLKLQRKSG